MMDLRNYTAETTEAGILAKDRGDLELLLRALHHGRVRWNNNSDRDRERVTRKAGYITPITLGGLIEETFNKIGQSPPGTVLRLGHPNFIGAMDALGEIEKLWDNAGYLLRLRDYKKPTHQQLAALTHRPTCYRTRISLACEPRGYDLSVPLEEILIACERTGLLERMHSPAKRILQSRKCQVHLMDGEHMALLARLMHANDPKLTWGASDSVLLARLNDRDGLYGQWKQEPVTLELELVFRPIMHTWPNPLEGLLDQEDPWEFPSVAGAVPLTWNYLPSIEKVTTFLETAAYAQG